MSSRLAGQLAFSLLSIGSECRRTQRKDKLAD
jgi:hypothetical protein